MEEGFAFKIIEALPPMIGEEVSKISRIVLSVMPTVAPPVSVYCCGSQRTAGCLSRVDTLRTETFRQ